MNLSRGNGAQSYSLTTRSRFLPILLSLLLSVTLSPVVSVDHARAATVLPAGFSEQTVFSGLINPTVIRFAPDGRVFVAEKRGVIKVFDNLTDPSPTTFADLRRNTYNFWDRGMLGMALDPNFPAEPWVYVLYAHDAEIGGQAPKYGNPPPAAPTDGDPCPTPPGPTSDGCVVSGRVSRLEAAGNVSTGAEQVLVEDWCQQYPSHSVGSLAFGPDGALYVSGGDGASFNFDDYGQDGNPLNPCGDPPGGVGGVQTPPTAEGGALRSQDLRTLSDPVSLDGAILRLDPDTGAGFSGNPLYGNPDPNAQRIIGYGTRNPFRMTARPGTNELWFGDVGYNTWEEINRLAVPAAPIENFGWPCYEGSSTGSTRQPGYDSANLNICENLYAAGGGAVVAPFFSYNHSAKVVTGETCPSGSSSVAGVAFYQGGDYPTSYADAMFFADYSRDCIWVMPVGTNGLPNPAATATFAAGAANPVHLEIGPGGDLFYADFDGGAIRRIAYTDPSGNQPPTARIVAPPTSGPAPLTVSFNGGTSTDPDPGTVLAYAWDTDNDGAFDDGNASTATKTFNTAGVYLVRLKVTDGDGAFDIETQTILVDASPPTAVIDTPVAGTTWRVGDLISFSGHASDPQQGTLPASALDWSLVMHHCPSNCHTHVIQTFDGVAGGSFNAPDHEYPSFMELRLTATDSTGLTHTVSRQLDAQTVNLTLATNPTGLQVVMDGETHAAPQVETVIAGSTHSISAPSPQTSGGGSVSFASWSDGGAQTHNIVAPTSPATYTANFSGGSGGVTLTPVADAWVLETGPTKNKGSDPALKVRESTGGGHHSYLQFVVTGLTAAPSSVKLRLHVTNGGPLGGSLYDVSDAWSESSITWANAPPISGTALNSAGAAVAGAWTEVDLTSYVTGNGTYSIAIRGDGSNTVIYSSSETVNAPQLVISLGGPVGGTLTPTDDARVMEASPTNNQGSDTALRVKELAGSSQHSYLKFVVTGLSSAPSQVKLRLYCTDASADGGSLYDVSDAWAESSITWANAPPIGGSALGSLGNVVTGAWVEVNLTSYVTGNGTYSIAIRSNSSNTAYFSSSEGANSPQLVVTP